MTGCSVVGCRSRFVKGGKHFFRFPKDYRSDVWVQFTRKGASYKPKSAAGICQDHFAEALFVEKKKGRIYLLKDAVPTIFFRDTKQGLEKVEVDYDPDNHQYIGEESIRMLKGTICVEDEQEIIQQRREKLKELKTLCRFCFYSKNEVKCVPITKLDAFNIDSTEMLITIGIGPRYNEIFSEIICEKCFQQMVSIDAYKKKCKKAQEDMVNEMQEIDAKLQEIRTGKTEERPWFKCENVSDNEEEEQQVHVEVIEEHLDDAIYDDGSGFQNESFSGDYDDSNDEPSYKFQQVIIKTETKTEPKLETDDEYGNHQMDTNDPDFEPMDEDKEDEESDDGVIDAFPAETPKNSRNAMSKEKVVYEVADKEAIITNPERNHFCLRIYECFFCQLKFAGKKTYKSHQCQVKERACEKDGCPHKFSRINAYNLHIIKVHGFTKISKNYCTICKNVVYTNEAKFKAHFRDCSKKSQAEVKQIECEICKKKCPSLKSYTIHKLFHDNRNLVNPDSARNGNKKRAPAVCELCGKEFTSGHGLNTHRRNVHLIGSKGETYTCDICSKIRPSKRSLFNHMRNVHKVDEATCSVCGKVFRTKALLQKHMMYHDESKRIHNCSLCPDKPAYFTNVALKRHQRAHHFQEKPYVCNIDYCQHAYTTNHQLKVHKFNIHGISF